MYINTAADDQLISNNFRIFIQTISVVLNDTFHIGPHSSPRSTTVFGEATFGLNMRADIIYL